MTGVARLTRPWRTAWWRHCVRTAIVVAACHAGGGVAEEPAIGIDVRLPQPMMANLGDTYRSVRMEPDRAAFERASSALERRHDLEFVETPLRAVLAEVAEKAGIAIGIDHKSLESAGIDIDAVVVTESFAGTSLRAALREMLGGFDLDIIFRNERLVVATAEATGTRLVRFFYPVLAGTDLDELMTLVEGTVEPESWNAVGGPAAIVPVPAEMGTGLVVSQTEVAHEEIVALLRGLDAALWTPDPADGAGRPRFVRTYLVMDPLLRDSIVESLADLCKEALPRGGDPDATITAMGDSVVVRSGSRPFHVMAAQLLTALQGLETIFVEEDEEENDGAGEAVNEVDDGGVRSIHFRVAGPRRRGDGR